MLNLPDPTVVGIWLAVTPTFAAVVWYMLAEMDAMAQRRMELAKLSAEAGRWSELRAVCQQVAKLEEAAELAW